MKEYIVALVISAVVLFLFGYWCAATSKHENRMFFKDKVYDVGAMTVISVFILGVIPFVPYFIKLIES